MKNWLVAPLLKSLPFTPVYHALLKKLQNQQVSHPCNKSGQPHRVDRKAMKNAWQNDIMKNIQVCCKHTSKIKTSRSKPRT